jgi:hypothetical protein
LSASKRTPWSGPFTRFVSRFAKPARSALVVVDVATTSPAVTVVNVGDATVATVPVVVMGDGEHDRFVPHATDVTVPLAPPPEPRRVHAVLPVPLL